jgi:hypothetical protein
MGGRGRPEARAEAVSWERAGIEPQARGVWPVLRNGTV